ncbi:MAG: chemotaxis protein CheV [Lachnospiraceae bacterium]|nr:chemotaxis protein CheV [Lachnospiraceae bacterium]MBP5275910.1 chemotaxis protein CheV [Lachnospiraceae bacterium]MBP5564813.1 chemotaxis protein CheV [Lachnospiraceae bacterium]
MESKILLETGTNELEVLEFTIAGNSYGINVAKIREIINYQPVTPVPNAHPSIEGIFMPRDTMITAVSLSNCLQLGDSQPGGLFIITNFNKLDCAFHVENVVGIHRVSWTQIMKPEATFANANEGISTGIVNINGKLIVILDFEKIVADINPETGIQVSEIEALGVRERSTVPILFAEDSALLNKLVKDSLTKAGYVNVMSTENGQEAWDILCDAKKKGVLHEVCKCLITDIEMPKMDGLRLTRLVKEDPEFSKIPVVIFSSLISEEMRRKGESIGANAMLSKPEIGNLVKEVDALVK